MNQMKQRSRVVRKTRARCGFMKVASWNDTKLLQVDRGMVGLLGMGRGLQRDLNRIAESADTSTPEGLCYVLTETILALLRHPDYCISGYSSIDVRPPIMLQHGRRKKKDSARVIEGEGILCVSGSEGIRSGDHGGGGDHS
ncbi:hypothetical protein E5676_scaffold3607G00340 [Cucumis melo var. makuwa]|uniref:Uncharacterized protein n=1 Tax=Cucumis melo var. makuwa TaxID=1194695 RepID=A0A5D3E292_CUCMM|nr:hypothetical protein E5676_scaffold3607G00340 [Cucumis melo var. makuwa]